MHVIAEAMGLALLCRFSSASRISSLPPVVAMKFLLRFLRRLPGPVLAGTLLNCALFLLTEQYAQLLPLREPFDVLSAGLTGFWAVRRQLPRGWSTEVAAGLVASLVVGIVRLQLGGYLGEALGPPAYLLLARAAVAGGVGAMLARLLHQRVVL